LAPKPVPAQLPDVLARVNGEPIRKGDFDKAVESVEQRAGRQVPQPERDRVYRNILDELIGMKVLQQEARNRKIEVSDAELNQNIDVFKQHLGGETEFAAALAAQKMTLNEFREETRSEIRVGKMLEAEVNTKVAIQPKDLDDFYAKNPDQFKQPEQVHASHILITVPQNADAKAKESARTKAAALLKQIRAGGDFAALAKKHSQDPGNAGNGGDLGFFGRGQMVAPFENAAFALQPGQVSDLVETQFGFHIIKLAEKKPGRVMTLDEVRPQLEQYLKNLQIQEKTQAFVSALKAKGKVEVLI
jgi:peptidyl-prolyl cis-trans isomerase C